MAVCLFDSDTETNLATLYMNKKSVEWNTYPALHDFISTIFFIKGLLKIHAQKICIYIYVNLQEESRHEYN